jgi:hypothetical protein
MARHDEERARRLAAALRENLKRRKAQARDGVEGLQKATADDPPSPGFPDAKP